MPRPVDRRTVLRATGAATLGATLGTAVAGSLGHVATADPDPAFAHGVASGDPLPNSVLLWTRVTPTPDSQPGSGTGPAVTVGWEVAADPAFASIVASGSAATGPERDHTVKVDVTGLAPATGYYFRFRFGTAVSAVGVTRTAAAADASVSRLRFGVVSCSDYQAGAFAGYRYLAQRGDLDAVLHLGDYLYEYGPSGSSYRAHAPAREMVTLADYRIRHAQYKTDPHLQQLHAAYPMIATWDDHESANNAWSDGAENHQPATEGPWSVRKAASQQAYFEWLPVRNLGSQLYRRLRFGRLAEVSMLDLRSYRSQQVPALDPGVDDPARSITGTAQFGWLRDGLIGSTAQWKLVGNSVMISPLLIPPLSADLLGPLLALLGLPQEGGVVASDQWDGYTADRRRLLRAIRDYRVRDTVFLTGDIHSSWACDLPLDAALYALSPSLSPSLATELICTSITSDNIDEMLGVPPRTGSLVVESSITTLNRHIKWVELDSHGASVLEVTPTALQMDWYHLANRRDPASTVRYGRSYRVRAGTQRVERVTTPINP